MWMKHFLPWSCWKNSSTGRTRQPLLVSVLSQPIRKRNSWELSPLYNSLLATKCLVFYFSCFETLTRLRKWSLDEFHRMCWFTSLECCLKIIPWTREGSVGLDPSGSTKVTANFGLWYDTFPSFKEFLQVANHFFKKAFFFFFISKLFQHLSSAEGDV